MTKNFNELTAKMSPEAKARAQVKAEVMLKELESESIPATQADILRLENKLEANKHEMLKWIMGMLVAQTALIVAVITMIH